MRRVWEGKWGGRGGREAGSRGEKLVYQRGLIMETHRKLLRRIFHDVAQEPWHYSRLTHTQTLFYPFTTPTPTSNPTQTGPPTPTWVSSNTAVSHQPKSRLASTVSISVFKVDRQICQHVLLISFSGCTCSSGGTVPAPIPGLSLAGSSQVHGACWPINKMKSECTQR